MGRVLLFLLTFFACAKRRKKIQFPKDKQKPHYKVLGVTQTSTLSSIKREYRRRALSLHPDKVECKNLEREECQLKASRTFAALRNAYEILTDPEKRRVYDVTGRDLDSEDPFFHEWWRTYKGNLLTNEEKFAMARVIETFGLHHFKRVACLEYPFGMPFACVPESARKIVTLTATLEKAKKRCAARQSCQSLTYEGSDIDPEKVMPITLWEDAECIPDIHENHITWRKLQGDHIAEKNLLIAFFDETCVESLRFKVKYPLPFSGWRHKDKQRGLWWDDFLLTYQHESLGSDLANFFGVSQCPTFVFVWQWSPLSVYEKFHTEDSNQFVDWMWENLRTTLTVVNNHIFPVVLYWEDPRSGWTKRYVIGVNETRTENTIVGHRYLAKDERFDGRSEPHQGLYEEHDVLRVEGDTWTLHYRCRDERKECNAWAKEGECEANPKYMHFFCRHSCGTCSDFDSSGALISDHYDIVGKDSASEKKEL